MSKEEALPKIKEELEKAKFTAYSDIKADNRQLHGNVAIVVRLDTAKAIVTVLASELEKILQEIPVYPDDVGGMYPYEIQMYSADVDKFVKKVRKVLKALE